MHLGSVRQPRRGSQTALRQASVVVHDTGEFTQLPVELSHWVLYISTRQLRSREGVTVSVQCTYQGRGKTSGKVTSSIGGQRHQCSITMRSSRRCRREYEEGIGEVQQGPQKSRRRRRRTRWEWRTRRTCSSRSIPRHRCSNLRCYKSYHDWRERAQLKVRVLAEAAASHASATVSLTPLMRPS